MKILAKSQYDGFNNDKGKCEKCKRIDWKIFLYHFNGEDIPYCWSCICEVEREIMSKLEYTNRRYDDMLCCSEDAAKSVLSYLNRLNAMYRFLELDNADLLKLIGVLKEGWFKDDN